MGGRQRAGESCCPTQSGCLDLLEAGCTTVQPEYIKVENGPVQKIEKQESQIRRREQFGHFDLHNKYQHPLPF